uniref:Retrotrans_gag domain-containing protein n=1 Tax=Haemonchus contortus TaxID=6289 RepID=A0A7I4Z532_HAECO
MEPVFGVDSKDGKMLTATSGPTVLMDSGTLEAYRGRPPGPYVPGTSWRTWWRLFTNFLILRKVVEEKEKRLVFLQEVGNSNYELLESLLQGQELESTDLASLSNAMEKHFQPKKLVLAERFGLMSKMQKPGQSLQEFYAELQKAANGCRFEDIKNYRDAMVTMVFIGGLQSLETRKRLLEKEDLTSKEALEQAEAWERVGVNAPHLKEGPQPLGIAQVKPKRMNSKQGRVGRPQALEKNVKRLGKGPARERAACNVCGKVGHFARELVGGKRGVGSARESSQTVRQRYT